MERLSTSTSQRHPLTPLGLIDGACEHPHTTDFSIYRTPWKQTSMHAHAPLRCARVHASSLWVARAYGPSHTSKDCASQHSYTLETSNKSRFRNSKKHAFAFDDVELWGAHKHLTSTVPPMSHCLAPTAPVWRNLTQAVSWSALGQWQLGQRR